MKIIDCTISEFLERTESCDVICFGGGNFFEVMCFDIGQMLRISGVIDNNPEKWGKPITAGSITTSIYSPERALELLGSDNTIILITASAHKAIISQLEKHSSFNDSECYVYSLMKFKGLTPRNVLSLPHSEPVIPPVIHYCWFGGNPMPERHVEMIKTWEDKCPGYEIVRWDESNYDIEKNPYLKKAYSQKEWTFFVDYARIDIIANYGGIYFDTDIEVLKCLDDLRRFQCFVSTEALGGINVGSGFGSVAGFPVMKDLLQFFDDEISGQTDIVLRSNMGRETEFFWKRGFIPNNEFQIIDGVAVLPFNVLAPKIKETGEIMMNSLTYSFHHFDGSWIKWEK